MSENYRQNQRDFLVAKCNQLGSTERIILFVECCTDELYAVELDGKEDAQIVIAFLQRVWHLTPREVRTLKTQCDQGLVEGTILFRSFMQQSHQKHSATPMPENYDVVPAEEAKLMSLTDMQREIVYAEDFMTFYFAKPSEQNRLLKRLEFLQHIWDFDQEATKNRENDILKNLMSSKDLLEKVL